MRSEKQRIEDSVSEFSKLMNDRLQEKRREGFTGWQGPSIKQNIESRLLEKVGACLQSKAAETDLVDIANFAMILYNINLK